MPTTLDSPFGPQTERRIDAASIADAERPNVTLIIAALVVLPPIVLIANALTTGVDAAGVLGYLMIWVCALGVASLIDRNPAPFDLLRFRFGGVFVAVFLVTMLVGTPSVFAEFHAAKSAWPYLLSLLFGFIATVIGFAVGDRAPGSISAARVPVPARTIASTALGLALIGVIGLALYLVVTPRIPLLEALRGASSTDLARAREDSLTLLQSPSVAYLFDFSRTVLLPAAAALMLLIARQRKSWWAGLCGVVLALVALLAAALTTEKSLVGRMLLVIAVAVWIARGRRPTWRTLALVSVVFLLFPFAISRATNASSNSNIAIAKVLGERMFRVPTQVHYHYVAYVDEDLDAFLLGRTVPNIGRFSPGQQVDLTGDVQQRIFPDAVLHGNANGSYLSNFYADFGMVGVLAGGLATGLALAWLDRFSIAWLAPEFSAVFRAVTIVQLVFLTSSSVFNSVLQFPFGNLTLLAVFAFVSSMWLPMRGVVRYGAPNASMKDMT